MFNSKSLEPNTKNLLSTNRLTKILPLSFAIAFIFAIMLMFNATSVAQPGENPADNNNDETPVYNMTVGNSVIGLDADKWSSTGEDLHYTITEPVSATFYPSTNTLNINGGTISQYYQYQKSLDGKDYTFEVTSPVSVNNIDHACEFATENNLVEINQVNINISADTTIMINQHNYNSDTSSASSAYYHHCGINTDFTNNGNDPCNLYLYGEGKLTFSANITTQCDIASAIKSNKFFSGQDSTSTILGSKIYFTSFNAHSTLQSTDKANVSAAGVDALQAYFTSTEFCLLDASFSSKGCAKFNIINCVDGVDIDKNSIIDIRNIDLLGRLGIGSTSQVKIEGICSSNNNNGITNHGKILMASRPDEKWHLTYDGNDAGESGLCRIAGLNVEPSCNGSFYSDGDISIGTFCIDYSSQTILESRAAMLGISCAGMGEGITMKDCNFTFNQYNNSYINYSCSTTTEEMLLEFRSLSSESSQPKPIHLNNVSFTSTDPVINCGEAISAVKMSDIYTPDSLFCVDSKATINKNQIKTSETSAPARNCCIEVTDCCSLEKSQITLRDPYGSSYVCGFECGNKVIIGASSILDIILKPESTIITYLQSSNQNDDPKIVMRSGISPFVYYGTDYNNLIATTTLDEQCYGKGVCLFRAFDNSNAYDLLFESNGGTQIDSQRVFAGYTAYKPADPVKDNVAFAGWFKDSGLQNAWDFVNDTVNSDTVLYAKWDTGAVPVNPSDGSDEVANTSSTSDYNGIFVVGLLVLLALSCMGTCMARNIRNKWTHVR